MYSDVIEETFQTLQFKIPEEVLQLAFKDKDRSYEQVIIEDILNKKVKKNLSIWAGPLCYIPLYNARRESTISVGAQRCNAVYRIPPEYRNNRAIVSVSRLDCTNSALPAGIGGLAYGYGSTRGSVRSRTRHVVRAALGQADGIRPNVRYLDTDLIEVTDFILSSATTYRVVAVLEFDDNFTELPPSMNDAVSSYFIEAIKAAIYNKLIIKIDQGVVQGGRELGSMKDYVLECRESVDRMGELKGLIVELAHLNGHRLREMWQHNTSPQQ